MFFFNSRVSRVTLALTLVAALVACVDETTPTDPIRQTQPQFGFGDVITVTNTSGGTSIGSLRWAMSQVTAGEVIHFDPSLAGQTIVLDTTLREAIPPSDPFPYYVHWSLTCARSSMPSSHLSRPEYSSASARRCTWRAVPRRHR